MGREVRVVGKPQSEQSIPEQSREKDFLHPYRSLGPHAAWLAFSQNYQSVGGSQSTIVLWLGLIMINDRCLYTSKLPFASLPLALGLRDHTAPSILWLDTPNPQQINNPSLSCGFFIGYFQYSQKLWRVHGCVRVKPEFRETLCPKPRQGRRKNGWLFYLEKVSGGPLKGHQTSWGKQDLTISKWQLHGFPHTCSKDPITNPRNATKYFPSLQSKNPPQKRISISFWGNLNYSHFVPFFIHTLQIFEHCHSQKLPHLIFSSLINPISLSCLQRAYLPKL